MLVKILKRNLITIFAVVLFTTALFIPINYVQANNYCLKIIAKDKVYTFLPFEIGKLNNHYYLKNANEVVEGIYLDTVKRSVNAEVVFKQDNSGEFYITNSKTGYELDKVSLLKDIDSCLNSSNKVVNAKFYTTYPTITKKHLENTTVLRSSFTTYFSNSQEGRKANIMLASTKINGTKILANEEFSFNIIVGKRTEENGFQPAKIILNGNYIDGVGGGVCQVSTTLYNCALLSGLQITEQHSHSLAVSYIEPSFDAMVNSITSDLKFINNTNYDIYISSFANLDKITIKIYGVYQQEKYERVSVIKNTIPAEPYEEVFDDNILIGHKQIEQYSKDGIESEGYLIKYLNGTQIKSSKIRTDKYNSVKGKILIGTKKED